MESIDVENIDVGNIDVENIDVEKMLKFLSVTTCFANRCLSAAQKAIRAGFWSDVAVMSGSGKDGWIGSVIRGDCFPLT